MTASLSLRVGISGASGLIGTALSTWLTDRGHTVVPLVRRAARPGEIEWDPATGRLDPADIATLDAVVNLSGAGIGDQRWSDSYRQTILDSRTDTTALLATTIRDLGADGPDVFVSGSAIGIYGSRGDEVLTEESSDGDGFLADVCRAWEQAALPASEAARVSLLRTGIVLTPDGGALAKMLPFFKFGVGGRFGRGDQYMSWITLHDEVRAIEHALTADLEGPVNLTAPNPATNREFTDALGDALRRPTLLPVPAFGPRLLLGKQLADALLFDSARVEPAALVADGFEFDHPELAPALADILA